MKRYPESNGFFKKKGYEVIGFTEEEDALNYARSHHVGLAILDLKLKKMSGIDVPKELKKTVFSLRAVILTAYPTIESARESMSLGVGEYCAKPIDNEELEEKVENILKSK
ncbi:MAG: response regulator [Desulfobacterales bacterium]